MHNSGIKLLNLMFDKDDTICVSDSKYAHLSSPLEVVFDKKITLISPNQDSKPKTIDTDKLIFVAINPISGNRLDKNVYKYRNFLLEIDVDTQERQIDYIKRLKVPYSALIWSGSKSLHILISLNEDLRKESTYRFIYSWLLRIVTLADQQLGNPSRSIRLAGAIRPETGKEQKLLEIKNRISAKELSEWLNSTEKNRNAKPKPLEPQKISNSAPDLSKLKPWTVNKLLNASSLTKDRNASWFGIAKDMAIANFLEDDTIEILSGYFVPQRDFDRKEWLGAIKSAFKHIRNRKTNG